MTRPPTDPEKRMPVSLSGTTLLFLHEILCREVRPGMVGEGGDALQTLDRDIESIEKLLPEARRNGEAWRRAPS